MKITTIGMLKDLIRNIDDDFKLEVSIFSLIPKEELLSQSYPYPWSKEPSHIELNDIGYSEKVVLFGIYKEDDLNRRN